MRLTWWAVCRDSVYYTLSVVVLIAVSQPSHQSVGPQEGTGARLPVLDPMAEEVATPTVECVDPLFSVRIGPSHRFSHCTFLSKDLSLGPCIMRLHLILMLKSLARNKIFNGSSSVDPHEALPTLHLQTHF